MKEDKEFIERRGPDWARYWLSPGTKVYHRDHVVDGKLTDVAFVMTFDQIIKKPVKGYKTEAGISKEPRKPFRIVGAECHWLAGIAQTYQKGLFHTNELYPASVIASESLEDWLDR